MMDGIAEKNKVTVSGEIDKEFELSHELYGEGFYTTTISCMRLSGTVDHVPIVVSNRMVDVDENWIGQYVCVNGQFRSYNKQEEGGDSFRLILNVFAIEFEVLEEAKEKNEIVLDGYICNQPTYRETTLGRKISDFMLAINREYGNSDYIPCIAWGRNARFICNRNIGDHVKVWGRIQSRSYIKKLDDSIEERTVYEVSSSSIKLMGDNNHDNDSTGVCDSEEEK